MATKIQWCEETWNPIVGCTKCSPGCLNCYAERMAIRLNGIFAANGDDDNWAKMSNILKWDYSKPDLYEFGKATGWNGEVELFINRLDQPLHWRKPRRIFVCSMSDLFHPKVPFGFISDIFEVTAKAPQHTYLFLTKRIERAAEFYRERVFKSRTPNIHIGVSISNQAEADEKIPILLQIPAAVRWLSAEPMLGAIDLERYLLACGDCGNRGSSAMFDFLPPGNGNSLCRDACIKRGESPSIDWVVVGCESGPKRRPFSLTWAESIVEQCKAASVPVFVKQIIANFGKVVKMPKGFPQEYPNS